MVAMLSASRSLQKAVFVLVLLFCIVTWKYQRTPSLHHEGPLPPKVGTGNHHSTAPRIPRTYSVKPLAYIFPQYYTFEDNNRLHGENFTEWVNVKNVTHNRYGLETIRPHESIGYYNGLAFATRKRWGHFLRDNKFHGAVFHHYWFDGRPVMEHIIQAMLQDGEPNVPFMLSWANEPWSKRWNGAGTDGEVLIAQKYGLHEAWRKHFDWLLPFFRHPQYIRSEGKIQFVVYHPSHAGHLAPQMFAAWRQWAIEEGLGGMDIIETRWGEQTNIEQWSGYPPDAVNEFMPHVAGADPAKYSNTKRISRVYHRGTLACWDTTPRHPADHKDVAEPFCHPNSFQNHLVEMFRTIKTTPNPIGVENFFFVNSLNEWGEGNALEPSVQFGDGYGVAMRNAMEITASEHIWPDISTEDGRIRDKQMENIMKQPADVCVLVRATRQDADDHTFTVAATLKSLQAQNNQKWRAAVVQTNDTGDFHDLEQVVLRQLDRRIELFRMPDNVKQVTAQNDGGQMATDWFINALTSPNEFCEGAKYLLITNGNNTYSPDAFDVARTSQSDLIGLNVESKQTIKDHELLQKDSWDARCSLIEENSQSLFNTSLPTMASFDITATFINRTRFITEGHKFSTYSSDFPTQQPAALATLVVNNMSWKFVQSTSTSCQVLHNPSYTACLKTGNFWFDSPIPAETGCYRSSEFKEHFEEKPDPLFPNAPRPDLYLAAFDLESFRQKGRCVRYKEAAYKEAKNRPPPPPPKPKAPPVVFHYSNPDPLEDENEYLHSSMLATLTSTSSTVVVPQASVVAVPVSPMEKPLVASPPSTTEAPKVVTP